MPIAWSFPIEQYSSFQNDQHMSQIEEKKETTVDFHEHVQSSNSDDISSAEQGGSAPSDAEKKVVRKINLAFVPLVCLIIFTQVNPLHFIT